MTWILALYLLVGGDLHVYVVDHGLTREDCTAALVQNPDAPLGCEPQGDEGG